LQTKITKGYRLEAVERYKRIATYVAIFSVLGRSKHRRRAPTLANITTRLLGIHEKQSPDRTGPKGCPSRKLSSSFSSTEDLAGGQAGGQHPRTPPLRETSPRRRGRCAERRRNLAPPLRPRRFAIPTGWGTSQKPTLHGPDVLLLIPLKLRDGKHALSSIRPPLASILLASRPKKARPPRPRVGR